MPTIKNPNAPATDPQISFIKSLAAEKGYDLASLDLDGLSKGQASGLIGIIKSWSAPTEPKASLTDLAAAMSTASAPEIPFTPDSDQPVVSFNRAQAKRLLSWYSVVVGETDGDEADHELEAILQLAYANSEPAPVVAAPVAAPKTVGPKMAGGAVAGHYAIGAEGATKFYRVSYGKDGTNWAGFCFLDAQASDDYYPVKGALKFEVLEAINADPFAAAKRYGKEIGKCFKCHKTLTNAESLEDGMGADCKKALGL